MKKRVILAACAAAITVVPQAFAQDGQGTETQDSYRFVIVPKVVHPWFDKVNDGARQAAAAIEAQTGASVEIVYSAPQQADVVQQNQIIESSIVTRPDGIAVDLLDPEGNRTSLEEAIGQGIPVTIFDSEAPDGMDVPVVGNDFCEQARMAAERLVELIGEEGQVAIMQGVPTAPNHATRARCHQETFDQYENVEVVATGIDNDDIEQAQQQAAAIMQANPELVGWVASDAAGPIGIGQAIQEAGKVGEVQMVGLDNLDGMLQLIRDGVADSSSSTKPEMQGYWSVMTMWAQATGAETPAYIDTGIDFITQDDLD